MNGSILMRVFNDRIVRHMIGIGNESTQANNMYIECPAESGQDELGLGTHLCKPCGCGVKVLNRNAVSGTK